LKRQDLFATPIWIDRIGDTNLNRALEFECLNYQPGTNLFDQNTIGLQDLHDRIQERIKQALQELGWNYKSFRLVGRQHPIRPTESDTPHHHPGFLLVAVYYVALPENSGDLLLIDPRGSVNWHIFTEEHGRSSRSYHRFRPEPGLLIIQPGYLMHMVETNISLDNRISIAVEIEIEI
jgi:uncharacterized protein (TIGR02466 family)